MSLAMRLYRDRAVFSPDTETLVLADVHLGRSRTAPIEAPLDGITRQVTRIATLVEEFDARRVVIAGDLLDAFDVVPPGVTERYRTLEEQLANRNVSITLVRGNHDPLLSTVASTAVQESVLLGHTVVSHGHAVPEHTGDQYIIGHAHPAIRIEGVKYPCYLFGAQVFEGADVLVLPAFSRLVRGTTINSLSGDDCHAPLLQQTNLDAYRPLVVDPDTARTLAFPPLGSLRAHL